MFESTFPGQVSHNSPSNSHDEDISQLPLPHVNDASDERSSNKSDDTVVVEPKIPGVEDVRRSHDSSTDIRGIDHWAEKEIVEHVIDTPAPSDAISSSKELEEGHGSAALDRPESSESARDSNIVTWDGENDPKNPRNWSRPRKWAAILVVSAFTFISPVSSTMIAPALPAMSADLDMKSTVESQLTMSIFIFAYGFGPLLFSPMSELYGRVPILQLANFLYLVFNLACGAAQTKQQMMGFRYLSGLGGSAPMAIGGGVLGDLFDAHERGQALSVYSLAPVLGPALGPIAGGLITQYSNWRWVFWATSIIDVLILVSGLFFLQETYAPTLLSRKCEALRKTTGNQNLTTVYQDERSMTLAKKIALSLVRPFRLLFTQPIVQFLSLYLAFIFGLVYIVCSTFPTLWTDVYHESLAISSLNYISLGIGYSLASQIAPRLNDVIYRNLSARNNGVGKPEFRVPFMIIGSILIPLGLLLYGWTAQHHSHWFWPNLGITVYGAGVILVFQGIQAYLIDAYTLFAASAIAASTVVRSFGGFGLPLFAPALYRDLGYGWGNSVLAAVGAGVGVPAAVALWGWGERMRGRGR